MMMETEMDRSLHLRETDIFNRDVEAFVERYAPGDRYREFQHDLRMLLSMAFREAQRPFVAELTRYRDIALEQSSLKPGVG